MVGYRHCYQLYATILPLMVLGSVGMPVVLEILRRLIRMRGLGLGSLSAHAKYTLLWTVLLVIGVGGLLVAIESTPDYQLRNPRDDTPGRLMLHNSTSQPVGSAPTTFPTVQERIRSQRLATMTPAERWKNAAFISAAARTTGMRTARMDEPSLSPASRFVLMSAMFIGGDVGGTAGGLRLTVVLLLFTAFRFSYVSPNPSKGSYPAAGRQQVIAIAAGAVAAMILLVGLTSLVLVYREAGSPVACLFEATSACCNVGFSTGLTTQLSTEGRLGILLAMILGRVIPLAFLLRCLRVPIIQMPQPAEAPVPAETTITTT